MPEISIGRLTLQVPNAQEAEARRLALLVAAGLAAAGVPDSTGDVSALCVELTANAAGGPDQLASRIVSEILRQLTRS